MTRRRWLAVGLGVLLSVVFIAVFELFEHALLQAISP